MTPTLWTIGYEKLWPDALVAELEAAGIQRVLDVRLRPQSRRPGMSKTKLALKLAEHGIAYEHRRELGTPMEIRGLFRAGHLDEARAAYRAHVAGEEELDALAAELDRGPRRRCCASRRTRPGVIGGWWRSCWWSGGRGWWWWICRRSRGCGERQWRLGGGGLKCRGGHIS